MPTRRLRLPTLALLLIGLLAPTAASADSGSDSQFVSATNSARSQQGLRSYAVASDLTSVARRWAAHMAATRTLAHNPNATSDVCCWSSMGENVGVGSSVSQVQSAFMNSSPHRANILSSTYTQVGIGTARGSDGRLYVDEVFRRPTSAGASAPSVTTTVHRAPRSAPARASRSAARLPHPAVHRSVRRVAPAALTHRLTLAMLREAGRNVRAAARHDSVAGAFGYLRLMVTLTR